MKSFFIILILTIVIVSTPFVFADLNLQELADFLNQKINESITKSSFNKPNVELQIVNGSVVIPDYIGHLNKNYQHEEFSKLIQDEIKKAEKLL